MSSGKLAPLGVLCVSILLYMVFGDSPSGWTTLLLIVVVLIAAVIILIGGGKSSTGKKQDWNSTSAGAKKKSDSIREGKEDDKKKRQQQIGGGYDKNDADGSEEEKQNDSGKEGSAEAGEQSDEEGRERVSDDEEGEEGEVRDTNNDSDQDSVEFNDSAPDVAPDAQLQQWMQDISSDDSDEANKDENPRNEGDLDDNSGHDTTVRAQNFWQGFEKKAGGEGGVGGERRNEDDDAEHVGDATDPESLARTVRLSEDPLPSYLDPYSSGGMVAKGHIDIDSENEDDDELIDTVISGSSRFDIGFADTKGKRSSMEDEMVVYGTFRDVPHEDYVAVFDGHGGTEASAVAAEDLHELLAKHLFDEEGDSQKQEGGGIETEVVIIDSLKKAFISCQDLIENHDPAIQAGSTAVLCYIKGKTGYVANAGDSRAVLGVSNSGGSSSNSNNNDDERGEGEEEEKVYDTSVKAVRVTTDHKPSLPAEEERIKAAGGFVTRTKTKRGEISRVCAILGVARALGDTFLQPMVTCVPDVFTFEIEKYDFLILACDGLWDVVSDIEAVHVVSAAKHMGDAAMRLRNLAFSRKSDDNISVLVLLLNRVLN